MQFGQLHPWRLLKEGFIAFIDDSALTRGAAIAFYAVTAIAPVLFIATAVAGAVSGPRGRVGAVRYQLRQMMSPESADLVQGAIVHVRGVHHSLQGSLIGLVALIVTASGVFTEMEDALNVIWKAPRTRILSLSTGARPRPQPRSGGRDGLSVHGVAGDRGRHRHAGALLDYYTGLGGFVIGRDQSRPVLRF